ncbi:MAG: hypothetical protein ABSG68_19255 [Thermoguttaceae bacterium]
MRNSVRGLSLFSLGDRSRSQENGTVRFTSAAVLLVISVTLAALAAAAVVGEESLAQRRARVESMDPGQKELLLRRQEQYQALSAAEKKRIRQLHEQLQQAPDAEKLREIMKRYCRWLATLQPYRRAELQELSPKKRIKQIKRIQDEQAKAVSRRLPSKDREAIVHWMEQYVREQESGLLEMQPEARRHQLIKMSKAPRQRVLMLPLLERWQSTNPAVHPVLSEHDVSELRTQLSPESRSHLESKSPAEQGRVLTTWLRQAARQELAARREAGVDIPALDEQLAEFFEYQLSDAERDRLMSLPGEEMLQRLRELYVVPAKSGEAAARRPAHAKKPAVDRGRGKKPAEKAG